MDFSSTGRVGRLSIRIPWKKLGWDPIIIILEDVFVSASQRDDQEVNFEFFFIFVLFYVEAMRFMSLYQW